MVYLDESPTPSPMLACVRSVPTPETMETPRREMVTLYGVPTPESLALALAASLESRKSSDQHDAVRRLGISAEDGARGDAAWHDRATGELVTRDLEIPITVLTETASALLAECGQAIRRLLAGLLMPEWPEGAQRGLAFSLTPAVAGAARTSDMLAMLRETDGDTFELEEN